jgi:hypothetical protein
MARKPKSLVQRKMLEARQHIKEKRYKEAQDILERINSPTAKKWLEQIHKIWFDKVSELVKKKKYEEALEILHTSTHPDTARWIKHAEKRMLEDDPFAEDDEDLDDLFSDDGDYHPEVNKPFDKRKAKATPTVDWDELHRQRTTQSSPIPATTSSGQQRQREMAQMMSFTTKAIVVLILYFVLFVPGVIANIVWHNEAKRMEKIAGQPLPGTGCLLWMRRLAYLSFVLAILGVFLFIAVLKPAMDTMDLEVELLSICWDETGFSGSCSDWEDRVWEQYEPTIRACDEEWDHSEYPYSFERCLFENGIPRP